MKQTRNSFSLEVWKTVVLNVFRYNILLSGTAFVAVEERSEDDKVQGPAKRRKVPVAPPPR